jgi:hypothetical protein
MKLKINIQNQFNVLRFFLNQLIIHADQKPIQRAIESLILKKS